MIVLYIIISIFISWIWVDYYRLIDVFDKNKLQYFILIFILGGASVYFALFIYDYIIPDFNLNGNLINDFLYSFLYIGFIEEIVKLIPLIIFCFLFKSQLKEPIDYVAFISVSALGFAAAENVLYFKNHSSSIINNRALLSTVSHMIDSSILIYGFIKYKFYYHHQKKYLIVLFVVLAALSHGFYNFWLLYDINGGFIITLLYFLITISIFSRILNNALNISSFFTYKTVINSSKVANRILIYYAIVFIIQLILLSFEKSFKIAVISTTFNISILILLVLSIRLSRFKLVKNHWVKLTLEFPFSYTSYKYSNIVPSMRFTVKGDGFNEYLINSYYENYFYLKPVSSRKSYLGEMKLAYIESKVFIDFEEAFYVVNIFEDETKAAFETYLIKAKTFETTMFDNRFPIVALLKIKNLEDVKLQKFNNNDFVFCEWLYIKPIIN